MRIISVARSVLAYLGADVLGKIKADSFAPFIAPETTCRKTRTLKEESLLAS